VDSTFRLIEECNTTEGFFLDSRYHQFLQALCNCLSNEWINT
jgi:hypothetical protein